MKKTLLACMLFPLASLGAEATNQELQQEIATLKERLAQLEKSINAQASIKKAGGKKILKKAKTTHQENIQLAEIPSVSPVKEQEEFKPTMKVGGNISIDMGSFADKRTNKDFSSNIRNARVNLSGKVAKDISYKMEVDFSGEKDHKLKKAYIDYLGIDPVELRLGRFDQDFGINADNVFPESHPLSSLTSFAQNGVRVSTHGEKWYSSIGVASNNYTDAKAEPDHTRTIFLRSSFAPIYTDKTVFHIGGSAARNVPNSKQSKLDLSEKFETKFLDVAIKKPTIQNIRHEDSFGGDLGYTHGPFSLLGEYVETRIYRKGVLKNDKINGVYAQASYTLTGEQRGYNPKNNSFQSIVPFEDFDFKGKGKGAWELAFRYSMVNFNGRDVSIRGGKMENYSASLNWYLNKNTTVMFTHIRGRTDNYSITSPATPNNRAKIYFIRTNITF